MRIISLVFLVVLCSLPSEDSFAASDNSRDGVDVKILLQNFNACAANASALEDKFEIEFYTNATIDLAYEFSNGKIGASLVRLGIRETVENLLKANWTKQRLIENYATHCDRGFTRGFAQYYYNQRKNMQR